LTPADIRTDHQGKRVNDEIRAGQPLFTIHAQASGELDYSSGYALAHPAVTIAPHCLA